MAPGVRTNTVTSAAQRPQCASADPQRDALLLRVRVDDEAVVLDLAKRLEYQAATDADGLGGAQRYVLVAINPPPNGRS